ncbi:MAG: redoxin family protein, partial [Alphaproteobacteria bacterium]
MRILKPDPESRQKYMRLLPLLLLLVVVLLLATGVFNRDDDYVPESRMVGYTPMDFTIPSLMGDPLTPKAWQNEVVLVNVFASWCEPCAIEHPLLLKLAQSGKVKIIGIAWRDTPENVRQWLIDRGNPYHYIGLDEKGATTLALGLSGVPETLVIDRKGVIVFHYKSAIDEQMINQKIIPKIEELQAV